MQFNPKALVATAISCVLFFVALATANVSDHLLEGAIWVFIIGGSVVTVATMIRHGHAGPYGQDALFREVKRWFAGRSR